MTGLNITGIDAVLAEATERAEAASVFWQAVWSPAMLPALCLLRHNLSHNSFHESKSATHCPARRRRLGNGKTPAVCNCRRRDAKPCEQAVRETVAPGKAV